MCDFWHYHIKGKWILVSVNYKYVNNTFCFIMHKSLIFGII
jgi:hypothetical protein